MANSKPIGACSGCRTTWTGLRVSHCGACHHTFTTPANFDRHRRGFRCTQPNLVGLVRKNRKWMMPGKPDTEQDVE